MKTIGVLTSGGDAPGMNAAIRSVVRTAASLGMKIKGIRRGYNGLIENDIFDMDIRSVSDIIQRGGTILYTARSPRFKTEEGMQEAISNCIANEIEGIVLTGSIGSATEPFNFEDEINKYFKNKYPLKVVSKESGAIGAAQIAMDVYNGKEEILGIEVNIS